MQKVMLAIVCTFVVSLTSSALGQRNETDGPHTISRTGTNEAQAKANAEAAVDAFVDAFALSLPKEDFVVGTSETGTWDASTSTYTIVFTIHWVDMFPSKQQHRLSYEVEKSVVGRHLPRIHFPRHAYILLEA